MEAEPARRFGDISITFGEDTLDVLPLNPSQRQGFVVLSVDRTVKGVSVTKGRQDHIGISGFGEVMNGAEPTRVDCRGDAPITRQHDDLDLGVQRAKVVNDLQPGFVGKF